MKSSDLVIPIYLDTNTLLDLLASVEGGFSIVEKITTRSSDSNATELSGRAEFGISSVLSLFKMDLGASGTKAKGQQSEEEHQQERYHTYGSLLNRLRANLVDSGSIKEIVDDKSWAAIAASDFVEARGRFIPNPLRASLQTVNRLLDMALLFSDVNVTPGGSTPHQKKEARQGARQMGEMRKLFQGIMDDLESERIQTYVVELTASTQHRVVLSLFTQYIRDGSGIELPYGEFQVLGKVARKIENADSVDLLRSSAFSGLSEEILAEFLGAFQELGQQGINVPELVTKVEAPAIQVIPIAVYV